jgi:PAS domain S-box-containing protein
MVRELRRAGFDVQWQRVDGPQEYLACLDPAIDLILADYHLPQFDALRALQRLHERALDIPFIIVSGAIGEDVAVSAVQQGAADYVIKDRLARLGPAVLQALEQKRLRHEKRQAVEALRESEARYRLLFERNPQPMWVYDLDTLAFLAVNQAAIRHYGYSRDEFLSMTLKDIRPPEDIPALLDNVSKVGDGIDNAGVWRHRKKDGTIIDVEITSHALEFAGRRAKLVLANDVTERRRAEMLQQIAQATSSTLELKTLLHTLVRKVVDVLQVERCSIYLPDERLETITDFVTIGVSESLLPLLEALKGAKLADFPIAQQLMQATEPIVIDNAAQSELLPRELTRPLGMRTTVCAPVRFGDRLIAALFLDTSNRRRFTAQEIGLIQSIANQAAVAIENTRLYERVRQAEARYRDLYENAPDGYNSVDAEGVITEMNATMLNWLGYSREEVIGTMRFADLLTPEGQRKHGYAHNRCQREGRLENVELDLVRNDGRLLPARFHVVAVRDAEGRYLGCRATARDITKERELEAQLLQAQKLESLGTLVGGIAHDFNNMLSGILGFSQLMLEEIEPTNPFYDGLRRIETLSDRASDMVKQLLAFSRRGEMQKTNLWLHPYLKEIAKLLERMIPENIEIETGLTPEHLTVEADPTQIQQVVMNLAVNARDAMPDGGRLRLETARVKLGAAFCQAYPDVQPGTYARLSVSDTGTGIAPEIRSRIFDPFFTTKELGKGTGLGLAMVYGIVKSHGGAIELESEVGRGTTFHVYLPLTEKPAATTAPLPAETSQGGGLVLLVDDEDIVLEVGRMALSRLGYQVLTAKDGLEALDVYHARRDEIVLVIMDVVMPKLGGREAFRELKRFDPRVKVLLATGYNSASATGEELRQEGVCGLVMKPYRIHQLAQAVRAALAAT